MVGKIGSGINYHELGSDGDVDIVLDAVLMTTDTSPATGLEAESRRLEDAVEPLHFDFEFFTVTGFIDTVLPDGTWNDVIQTLTD